MTEINLNAAATETVTATPVEQTSVPGVVTTPVGQTSAPEIVAVPPVSVVPGVYINAYNFLIKYKEKIVAASQIDVTRLGMVPGSNVLFKTVDSENTPDLILFKDMTSIWVKDVEPATIRILNSGIVAESPTQHIYITKTNSNTFNVIDGRVVSAFALKKSKDGNDLSEVAIELTTTRATTLSADDLKLWIKNVSTRLAKSVEAMTDVESIRASINTFRSTIDDINHLIKIDRELLSIFNS